MLIHVGAARSERIDLGLAWLMSTVAGALNAVGFLVAGSFTANMTGNVSLFSETLGRAEAQLALSFAGLVAAFVLGAGLAATWIQVGERLGVGPVYALAVAGEAALLLPLGAGFLWVGGGETLLVAGLSFLLGLQNAVTTLISGARVRTTHVSGMVTDLGIELAALLGGAEARGEAAAKLKLHGLTLAGFAAGGVLGTLVYFQVGAWLFVMTSAVLFAVAVPQIVRGRRT